MKDRSAADVVQMAGVRFRWPGRQGFSLAVDEFRLARGERLFLAGPTGSGKSTFLSLLAGIVTPQAGRTDWTRDGCQAWGQALFRCPIEGGWPSLDLSRHDAIQCEPHDQRDGRIVSADGMTGFQEAISSGP